MFKVCKQCPIQPLILKNNEQLNKVNTSVIMGIGLPLKNSICRRIYAYTDINLSFLFLVFLLVSLKIKLTHIV